MDDPLLVGFLQGLRDLLRDVQGFVHRDGAARDPLGEGQPLDQLEDEKDRAAFFFEVVDGGDAGMVEGSEEVGLAAKAAQALGVVGELRRQDLDRDLSAEARIEGAVHLTHAARPERAPHLVVPEP